jgi:hypothetical protein
VKTRLTFLLLGAAAACGGSKTTTVSNTTNTTSTGGLPPAYAAVFQAKELSFPAELTVSEYGDTGPVKQTTKGTVKCVISDVKPSDLGGQSMTLACTSELEMPGAVDGTYVGTGDGLWRIGEGPDGKLDPTLRLLPAKPAAGRVEHKDPAPGMDAGMAYVVEANGADWCATEASWGGDEGGFTLCFREGAGIVGGHSYFAGGSSRDLYFGDVKHAE